MTMDFNWIDWVILGFTGLGLLFGIMWGTLRILFFAVCIGIALVIRPITMPITGDLLDQLLFNRLGDSNTMAIIRDTSVLVVGIFVPFVVFSILLAWPYSVLARWLNPFINFCIGAAIGAGIGFALACAFAILYAYNSVDQSRYPAYCSSTLMPFVIDTSPILLGLVTDLAKGFPEAHSFLLEMAPALDQADPRNAATCGGQVVLTTGE